MKIFNKVLCFLGFHKYELVGKATLADIKFYIIKKYKKLEAPQLQNYKRKVYSNLDNITQTYVIEKCIICSKKHDEVTPIIEIIKKRLIMSDEKK